jgi:CheY-like chemotaxis protein
MYARQLCVSARQNRLAAGRLVSDRRDTGDRRLSRSEPAVRHAVLVVDDYEDCRDLVSMLLHDAGFIVRTASNGLEAILAAYEMRPAVIVMDVTMPVLDGLEATRSIKAIDAIRDSRVIAYTATPALPDVVANGHFAAVLEKAGLSGGRARHRATVRDRLTERDLIASSMSRQGRERRFVQAQSSAVPSTTASWRHSSKCVVPCAKGSPLKASKPGWWSGA